MSNLNKAKAPKRAREEETPTELNEQSALVVTSNDNQSRESLLQSCAVFRVMSGAAVVGKSMTLLRRSDVVEVLKCKFGTKELAKAFHYFQTHFTSPLTKLRFQAWLSATQLLPHDTANESDAVSVLATTVLGRNAKTLKTCDLSRNRLTQADVPLLIGAQGLHLSLLTNLEVLDFSYNPIGNEGAVSLFKIIQSNASIRAVILKHCSIDDTGAEAIGDLLRSRPKPSHNEAQLASMLYIKEAVKLMFFVNLNENRIGAVGTKSIAYKLPDFISITIVKQQPKLLSDINQ